MSKRFLSKVVVGAALGCASLLIASPALAASDDGKHHGKDHGGWIYTVPEPTKSGHKAYIVQICEKEQKKPYVWSEVTGKQKLEPQPWHSKKLKKALELNNAEEWHGHHGEKGNDKKHKIESDKKHKKHDGNDKKHHIKDDKKHKKHHDKKIEVLDELEKVEKKDHPYAYFAKVWIPDYVEPGAYKLKGSCAKGKLIVAPHGWVDGGDGGLGSGTNTGLVTGGAGMIAAATLGGLALMRRRAADGTVA